ncbi:MAG: acyltransferase [Synechococcales bacterium]|nr:acyltransferase [Synechococcales bacterium]
MQVLSRYPEIPVQTKSDRKTLNLIQIFRGLAALAVFGYHLSFELQNKLGQAYPGNPFLLGWIGVDFFFVLSGLIIFYAHHRDLGKPKQLKPFLIKRAIRIYPIYWVIAIALVLVQQVLPGFSDDAGLNLGYLLQSLLLWPQSGNLILTASWTLSHEIFFYLIFALLITFPTRIMLPAFAVWISAILLNVAGFLQPLTKQLFLLDFILRPLNLEFLLGCAIAFLVLKRPQLRYPAFLYLGLGLLTLSSLVFFQQSPILEAHDNLLRVFVFGIPFALILWGAVAIDLNKPTPSPALGASGQPGRSLSAIFDRSLLYLGNSSYSVYLIHAPILSVLGTLLVKLKSPFLMQPAIAPLLMTAIALPISILCYTLLEKPLLDLTRKWTKPFLSSP